MIEKSEGQNPSEKTLNSLCDGTFLKIWSYSNPFKDDAKELCDLIALFENHLFLFFVREKLLKESDPQKMVVSWDRWYRSVIEGQTRTCHGAERYIRSGRKIFLDPKSKVDFPIPFDPKSVVIHKILIANGAKEACLAVSDKNENGSLGVVYKRPDEVGYLFPFTIAIDRSAPVHVFDSHNLPILLKELDTFFDFSNYIVAKEAAIEKYDYVAYCGEEDLLGHYLHNWDHKSKQHYIGSGDPKIKVIMIAEGDWNEFIKTDTYITKHHADQISYIWDNLIQKTCDNALAGILGGNSNPFAGQSAIYEMAKEPRFVRRGLSENILEVINRFSESESPVVRHLSYMPSFFPKKAYVFLQLKVVLPDCTYEEYQKTRRFMLELACGMAKNVYPHLETVIGIATEPPKLYETVSEDFILMKCSNWPRERSAYFEEENKRTGLNFFKTGRLVNHEKNLTEFPDSSHGKG